MIEELYFDDFSIYKLHIDGAFWLYICKGRDGYTIDEISNDSEMVSSCYVAPPKPKGDDK